MTNWIDKYEDAKKLILDEFNLSEEITVFKIDLHRNIGHGWANEEDILNFE
ncbi:MAG: hypothetical protein LBI60_05370 [Bacteroidales bacterium]|nr:hypothetical protein [Bacteroidales bacterium]